jgi:hypothetical protein
MADTSQALTPQQALKAGQAGLLTSLVAAARAVENEGANPAMVAGALQGVVAAQQAYNSAVVRIPLRVMTEEWQDLGTVTRSEPGPEVDPPTDHPAATIISANPRVWADRFLVENKNKTAAVDRESLTHWFGYAIAAGAQSEESARALWEKARAVHRGD